MNHAFIIDAWFPTTPGALTRTWLSSDGHSAMTGARASISSVRGSHYRAWDGYIEGTILDIEPRARVLMTFRTTEFLPDAPDTLVEIVTRAEGGGTRLTLHHQELRRDDVAKYRSGWSDFYFVPMTDYFAAFLRT